MEAFVTPAKIFCASAEIDTPLFKQLERQLSVLLHEKSISIWHQHQIVGGSDSQIEVNRHLNTASLILLLISPDFLASDYLYGRVLKRAMQRHNNNEARVIPILLRACRWEGAPFENLQVLPRNEKPLTSWRNRDEGFAEIAEEICIALKALQVSPLSPPNPGRIQRCVLGLESLPLVRTPVGRDPLLLRIKQQLQAPGGHSPIIVLHGQPGAGKTTLAAYLAYDEEIHATFPGGVLLAHLGIEPSLDAILEDWARPLGTNLSRATTIPEKIGCIQERWGRTPFLLILDDLWEINSALNPLLRMAGPGCATLITTRQRTVADDLCHMTGTEPILVGELDEEAALILLLEICQSKLPDRSVLVPLMQNTGGLPLTIELMGAYINHKLPVARKPLQIRQELRRIEKHLHLPGDAGPRNLPLKEVIDLSVDDLPNRTKRAFFALGTFAPKPATFSEEAMRFVTGADPEILQDLYQRHLLDQSSSGRYMLHQSLASAAQAHLSSRDSAWTRHRFYYQKQIERKIKGRQAGSDALKKIDWRSLFYDLPQMRAIHLPKRPNPTFTILVNRLAGSLSWLRWLDALPLWLKNALSHMLLTGLALSRWGTRLTRQKYVEAILANYQGWLYAEAGDRNRALSHYTDADKLLVGPSHLSKRAEVLNNLGKLCYMEADYRLALNYYHQALKLLRELGARGRQAHTLTNIGAAFDMLNRADWAIQSLQAALTLYQDPEVKDKRGEALTLFILGTCYHGLGKREEMLAYLKLALEKHTNAGNNKDSARVLMQLGLAYLDFDAPAGQEQEFLETAMGYFQQALELQKKFGDLAWQGRTLSRIGQVYARKGEVTHALDAYMQALSIHQHVDYKAGLSATLGLISNLFSDAGKDRWAQNIANEGKSEHTPFIGLPFKHSLKPEDSTKKD